MAYKNDRTKNRRRYKSRYRSGHNYKTNRSSSQTKAAVLVSVLTFVIIASVVVTFAFGDTIYESLESALKNARERKKPQATKPIVVSTTPITKPTDAPTEAPTTEPQVPQDEQFMSLLELSNLSMSEINDQIIFVDSDNSNNTCKVYCYEKGDDGVYKQKLNTYSGYIGSEGAAENVGPTESKTPVGLFNIEYACGTYYDPGTALEYSQFKYGDYWITDPGQVNYNRWITSDDYNAYYNISQPLWEFSRSYPYAIVFDYNREPVDPAPGCAKFSDVYKSESPQTKGGIGLTINDLKSILLWLDPSDNPQISISE